MRLPRKAAVLNPAVGDMLLARVTGWQRQAACNGTTLDMFDEPKRFIAANCSGCPVVAQCGAMGDADQGTGVWGGTYRDINKGYRVHLPDGRVKKSPYVSGIHVAGDNERDAEPTPNDGTISSVEAMRILGVTCRRLFKRLCERNHVKPMHVGRGARPSYWAPEDIETVRARRASTNEPEPNYDGTISTRDAMTAIGVNNKKSFKAICNRYGVTPKQRGGGPRPAYWAQDDIEWIVKERNGLVQEH